MAHPAIMTKIQRNSLKKNTKKLHSHRHCPDQILYIILQSKNYTKCLRFQHRRNTKIHSTEISEPPPSLLSKTHKPLEGIRLVLVLFIADHVFIRTTKEPVKNCKSCICQNPQNALHGTLTGNRKSIDMFELLM